MKQNSRQPIALLQYLFLDYTHMLLFCSIIVNNPCTLEKPIFMTFYRYNNQWKRIAAAVVRGEKKSLFVQLQLI